ncbi:hypothetical protein KKF81_02280 [Candidatus Micrarchaeota archaeon]|nr:hypothetical protein [Candidatus Micrarchaeota archaeon]MBU1165747.1 hypothetical protein [Candidatus Micrarchaeota archaeon]MBU1887500.1 hypothetical protein [Candidatus Micrarchaeota archaeon]
MDFILPLLFTLPTSAMLMISAGLTIAIFITSCNYLIAYTMQNAQMHAVAKEELAALVFTIFIIFFWLVSDSFFNGLIIGLLYSSVPADYSQFLSISTCVSGVGAGCITSVTNNHLNLALASMGILEEKLKSQYVDLFLFEALIGFLSTISFPIGSPVGPVAIVSFSLAPFTALTMLSQAHTFIVETIGYMLTVVWAKEFILIFSRDVVPLLLFPLGLVMRAIPLFRKTGSSIIAIAFTFYFIVPFAFLFSNYLIFDIYEPADFSYTPTTASFFDTERDALDLQDGLDDAEANPHTEAMLEQFEDSEGVVGQTYTDPNSICAGNVFVRMFCSFKNTLSTAVNAGASFASTVWNMWKFMMGMSGDFFQMILNNPALPTSASAGLYFFVINEVVTISPFIILVLLTTVIEIIFSVTMYRNIALIIGGDPELIGLTKMV